MANQNLLHIKGSRVQIYKTLPSSSVGNDGDIILAQIQGRGVFLCSKVNGKWHVSTKMEESRKIEKTSIKDLKVDRLRVGTATITKGEYDVSVGDFTLDVAGNILLTPSTDVKSDSPLKIKEASNAVADTAAYGQLWVKTATPNQLYFTTDAGDDIQITSGTATAFVGDITSVVAGTNCSGGGTSGDVTINVDDAFLINNGSDTTTGTITADGFDSSGTWNFAGAAGGDVAITEVHSGTSFSDDDTSLMTAGAIKEKIENYSYTTTTGTVTSIATTTPIEGGTITGTGTITHANTAGYKHIPTGGSSGEFLKYDSSGTAVWATPSYISDTNTNQLTTFTVSATTDSNATTISQGDDLMFTAGTGITCETTADGTVTITNTVSDTNTTYSAGSLLDLSTTTFNVDLSELTDGTADVVGSSDELVYLDAGSQKRKQINEIKLGQFNNDQGWTANAGDMTGVDLTGGTGISIDSETNTTSGAYSSTITCNLEGTELISTGEGGANKYLREDGDGSCSWQTVSASGNFVTDNADDTMAGTLTVDKDVTATTTGNQSSLNIDYDHTGIVASGQTITSRGIQIDMNDDSVTHVGNHYLYGILSTITSNATGTSLSYGFINQVSGADTQYGIYTKVDDGQTDYIQVSSADTADYFSMATTTHGATTLATVDSDATIAHLTLAPDGNLLLSPVSNLITYAGSTIGTLPVAETFSDDSIISSGGTHDTHIDFRVAQKVTLALTSDITTMNLIFPSGFCANFVLICSTNGDHDVTNWKVFEGDESAASGDADVLWAGGSVPAFTSSGIDIVSFVWDGVAQKCYGVASLDFSN
tara:strand:- start:1054 stop:3519 length:2466 start_codon:yes stop_codon:yes gene_type:complete